MEKPKLERKTYKKIVPLRGSLLQKLRNEFKKELSKNDSSTLENKVDDTVNNNHETSMVPEGKIPLKSPENKIIIQKVEKVKIEAITTSSKGPLRRISSLFGTPNLKDGVENKPGNVPQEAKVNDAIQQELAEKPCAIGIGTETPVKSITLLTAKIPENSFNKTIPLKMVRIIKQPKPKPNLRHRFHRVETFKAPDTVKKIEPDPVDFLDNVQVEALIPDIEMKEEETPNELVKLNVDTAEFVPDETELKLPTHHYISSDEEFQGFDSKHEKEQEQMLNNLKLWNSAIFHHKLVDNLKQQKKAIEIESVNEAKTDNMNKKTVLQDQLSRPINISSTDLLKDSPPIKSLQPKTIRVSSLKVSQFLSKAKILANDKNRAVVTDTVQETVLTKDTQPKVQNVNEQSVLESQSLLKAENCLPVDVAEAPLPSVQNTVAVTEPSTSNLKYQPCTSKTVANLSLPSTSKESLKCASKPVKKATSDDWQNDILAVIGASRIRKIDENLKEIPNLITGNAIETENVEFKLIIRYLLRKFKLKSIMETIEFDSQMLQSDGSLQNDDSSDSFNDESNDPNSFFDQTTEDSDDNATFCENFSMFQEPSEANLKESKFVLESDNIIPSSTPLAAGKIIEFDKSEGETLEPVQVPQPLNISTNPKVEELSVPPELDVSLKSLIDVSVKSNEEVSINQVMEIKHKRKRGRTSPIASSTLKKLKTDDAKKSVLKPWSLLIDGERRLQSLRSSSCDSGAESQKITSCEDSKGSVIENDHKKSPNEVETSGKEILELAPAHQTPIRSSCDSSAESSQSQTPTKLEHKSRSRTFSRTDTLEELREKSPSLKISSPESILEVKSPQNIVDECNLQKHRTKSPKTSQKLAVSNSTSVEPLNLDVVLREKITKVQELKYSDSDSGSIRLRRQKAKPLKPLSDDSQENELLTSDGFKNKKGSKAPLNVIDEESNAVIYEKHRKKNEASKKIVKRKTTRKILDSDSDSEHAPNDADSTRNMELKSRLSPIDLNSKPKNRTFIRNDYLIKSSDKQSKSMTTELSLIVDKLEKSIEMSKSEDPTYVKPPTIEKRQRLRTSAFKGKNYECSNDEDIQDSQPDTRRSVSCELPVNDVAKKPESIIKHKRGRHKRSEITSNQIEKKKFVQEPLQQAIESQVAYDAILESIKFSVVGKKGRADKKAKLEYEAQREKDYKSLQALKHFLCGSCQFKVAKHKWVDHFVEHGGIAWIEGFEPPIKFDDWNEALRRSLKNYKVYNLSVMICPHCKQERFSAIGHLSHLLTCGESEEAIEQIKIQCELCDEKFLPFNANAHRVKCSGYKKIQEADDGDDEVESSESDAEELKQESFNASGRTKRKAVKKAEKKFKKILKKLDQPTDLLKIVNGEMRCHVCGESDFQTEREALKHIKKEHQNDRDFEGSDSDALALNDESSDETDGSSGVESSEADSNDDESCSDYDESSQNLNSSKTAKPSSTEPQEVKNGRAILAECVESFHGVSISSKTIHWTQQFVNEHWKAEVFPQFVPKYELSFVYDLNPIFASLNFNVKSCKFGIETAEVYSPTFEKRYTKDWKQLEIGNHESNMDSSTIYCGGGVSAIDWAPISGDLNFLAVACNNSLHGTKLNLTETSKSCIQLYEFKNIFNEKFQGFDKAPKLCYVIIINDGPIWSIKFHPSESPIEKRIGLLAVATANQSILVYSLPYLNQDKPSLLQIEPNLVCNLDKSPLLFNNEYLMQTSKVAWFQKNNCDSILAAGFISGAVGVWNISREDFSIETKSREIYPQFVIQAHIESVKALDLKASIGSEIQMLTASTDRKIKLFTFDMIRIVEIANFYSQSRVLCAEWWMHWPSYCIGYDDSLTYPLFTCRQPLEFGSRNSNLLLINSSINHLNINHWLNFVMVVTDSGDVMGCNPNQMYQPICAKDRWKQHNFMILSSTDYNKINIDGVEEIGVIFNDLKSRKDQPKKFRLPSLDRINELQINQVCFNRNEKSYRFYALGYETGFIRIRYLKNSK